MSRTSDNIEFANMAQAHLKAAGHYIGQLDGWAGRMTRAAYRAFAGLEKESVPLIEEPVGGLYDPTHPAGRYVLPAETTEGMSSFYGAPSASPGYLDYFSFPHPDTRLYSRGGAKLRDIAGDERQDHRCHRLLTTRLTSALAEIYARLGRAEYERQGWHIYGGCHNYRRKTGGGSLSTHAWGVAVDINPGENPYSSRETTFSLLAIDIMERWGFLSGGRAWGKDWMHFQAVVPHVSAGSYYARHGLPKNIVTA